MRINQVVVSKGLGGYYFDDLKAIKAGAQQDGFLYVGKPLTEGHRLIRQPGETISLMLILDDGTMVFGDGVSIQYSGVVGRDPVFLADKYAPIAEQVVAPALVGKEITTWRAMCDDVEKLRDASGKRLHTGLRYAASQALLAAVAHKVKLTPAEVVAREYNSQVRETPVPVLAQSGDDRYIGADKMILKQVPVITQGLFNHISKVGENGEKLLEYTSWLRRRVEQYGAPGYKPTFHLDLYGMVSEFTDNDPERAADYLMAMEEHAGQFPLRVEHPLETGDRDRLVTLLSKLRAALRSRNSTVEICADDWCNTLEDVRLFADAGAVDMIQIKAPDLGSLHNSAEAVLEVKKQGIKAFLGGTCNGTDQSSRLTVQVALGTSADLIYNKPGMGVDEGFMIVTNEMNRTLALVKARRSA